MMLYQRCCLLLAIFCSLFISGSICRAQGRSIPPPQLYIQGMLGYAFAEDSDFKVFSTDSQRRPKDKRNIELAPSGSFSGGSSLGILFGKGAFAAEIEISAWRDSQKQLIIDRDIYRYTSVNKSFLLNAMTNISTGTPFLIYLGGGFGLGISDFKFDSQHFAAQFKGKAEKSTTPLIVQGILGASFRITSKIEATIDYRPLFPVGELTLNIGHLRLSEFNLSNAHRAQAGIRFRF